MWSVITDFLSFFGLRGKTALPVLKSFLSFLDFYVHTNPDFSLIPGVPNCLTIFCFKAGGAADHLTLNGGMLY